MHTMGKRVSRSLLDPYILPLVPGLYSLLRIPRKFPPEGIILIGHIGAIVGAFGFASALEVWWAGLIATGGVVLNHVADMVDGTHARATGQCRNGGELLDHFTDPLSFSYWMIGIAVSIMRLDLALACVIAIYATAVLTNIRAKIIGEFGLAAFGPTEFKGLLIAQGLVTAGANWWMRDDVLGYERVVRGLTWWLTALTAIGIAQLLWNLIRAVKEVNASGRTADTTAWETRSGRK